MFVLPIAGVGGPTVWPALELRAARTPTIAPTRQCKFVTNPGRWRMTGLGTNTVNIRSEPTHCDGVPGFVAIRHCRLRGSRRGTLSASSSAGGEGATGKVQTIRAGSVRHPPNRPRAGVYSVF